MTSARLSPAANLLRNSKLFALPPAVPLPPAKPTVDVVFKSDTATTVHPTRAAIYTDSPSLSQGDWGLKRPLPGKAFHKTSTPVIRLRSDIDTQEHIADFDSAADHVQTLQKWQNYPVMLASDKSVRNISGEPRWSAFDNRIDNTTAKPKLLPSAEPVEDRSGNWSNSERQHYLGETGTSSTLTSTASKVSSLSETLEQFTRDYVAEAERSGRTLPPLRKEIGAVHKAPQRWRYAGPWLAGMTNMDFEEFLSKMDGKTIEAFREHLKKGILARRRADHQDRVRAAVDEAQEPPAAPSTEVSSEEVNDNVRRLRENTPAFATEIARFFDLPDAISNVRDDWMRLAGQETAASSEHQKAGPPRTHPSAGFSYLRSIRYANMSSKYGPQEPNSYVPARHLKKLPYAVNNSDGGGQANQWGVGGFVVNLGQTGRRNDVSWKITNGGPKMTARLKEAFVASDGSIQLRADLSENVRLNADNVPVHAGDLPADPIPKGYSQLPYLDESRRVSQGRQTPRLYARDAPPRASSSADAEDDIASILRASQ